MEQCPKQRPHGVPFAGLWRWFAGLSRALRPRWPRWSLPTRIVISVFMVALVTGIAVAWVSTRTIESFLHEKLDQKFPVLLRTTAEQLDLWYSQRELDMSTFARSATIAEKLGRVDREPQAAREDLAIYLAYVLESFPQYQTLFLLGPDGRQIVEVGQTLPLPAAYRERLSTVSGARLEPLRVLGDRKVQIVSTAVMDGGEVVATLHAALRARAVESALAAEELGDSIGLYVVSPGGEVLLRSPGAPMRARYDRALPVGEEFSAVVDYSTPEGRHVVGCALPFARFGYSLVVEESYETAFIPVVSAIRRVFAINLGIVLVFCLLSWQMARSIVRPILALSEASRRIAAGQRDIAIDEASPGDELGALIHAFNDMSVRLGEKERELEQSQLEVEEANARLMSQNSELQRVNEVFQQLSITDELTRLHNHRFFQDHLPREVKRADRTGEPLALVLIDIDDFKKLNDRHGHAVGDAVLRKVAEVMNQAVRDMDLLARYGGEEFVLLASQTDLAGAKALAEKMRIAISGARFPVTDLDGSTDLAVTASLGVAQYRGDAKRFFGDADRALYLAKGQGKDCVVADDFDDSEATNAD